MDRRKAPPCPIPHPKEPSNSTTLQVVVLHSQVTPSLPRPWEQGSGVTCPAPFQDGDSPKARTTGLHHALTRVLHVEALSNVLSSHPSELLKSPDQGSVAGLGTLSRYPAVPRSHGTGEHFFSLQLWPNASRQPDTACVISEKR